MQNIRNKVFWAIDKLKGSPLKKDLDEISDCLSLDSKIKLGQKIEPKLKALLNLAVEKSNFYKKYKNYNSLSDFPVINKTIIKEHFQDFQIIPINSKKLNSVSTSGSTGTPFTIYQTKRKITRNTADTIYFGKAAGFTIGDQLLYLRLWSAQLKKNKIIAKLQNIQQLNVNELNDDNYLSNLITSLQNDTATKGWLGYASGFETICQYLDKIKSPKLDCKVKSIIAMSEYLSPTVKLKMEYYFQCPTVSRYSNVENGIIAQQLPNEDNFTINWASYIVEILNMKNDLPVKDGTVGRIVITGLYNHATLMIRYDTGDIGAFNIRKSTTDAIPKLQSIQGRKMDALFTTKGTLVNPFIMCSHVYKFPEVDQIQYVQYSENEYTIKINSKIKFEREDELLDLFISEVGEDASVIIEYVAEVTALKSGKRKLTVNLFENN